MKNNTLEMRMARMEAITNQLRAEMDDVVKNAYAQAVEDHDEARAAEMARVIRNRLLDESDKQFSFDRLLPAPPTGSSFTAWLSWLRELADIALNDWAVYRKALRDLTKQEGFPFNIVWPVAPDKE